jgi:hypothetical protein
MEVILDKAVLRESLKEWVVKEPDFVDKLISEINNDLKKHRLQQIIKEDFEEYHEVFKALA